MSAAVVFAFGAGVLAPVNPCGFALLPSFVTLYLGDGDTRPQSLLSRAVQGVAVGGVLSASFAAVFVTAGLALAAGLRPLLDVVPWAAVAIGVALAAVGAAMLAGRRVSFLPAGRVSVDRRTEGGVRRVVTFGATYAVASLSCTLAVFLIVISQALATGNVLELLAVFGAYAAGAATVLMTVALSAAFAKGLLTRMVQRGARLLGRIAGALLVLSGAYLIAYWLPPLTGASSPASGASQAISGALSEWLSPRTGVLVGVFAAIAIAATVLVFIDRQRRHVVRPERPQASPALPTPET